MSARSDHLHHPPPPSYRKPAPPWSIQTAMYTLDLPDDDRLRTYDAIDIETVGFDGAEDCLVAVGVGFVDDGAREIDVHTLRETESDEAALVDESFAWFDRCQPDDPVTYNHAEFDLSFLRDKLASLDREPTVAAADDAQYLSQQAIATRLTLPLRSFKLALQHHSRRRYRPTLNRRSRPRAHLEE